MKRCTDLLLDEAQGIAQESSATTSIPEPKLVSLSRMLSRVFRARTRMECIHLAGDYKVYINEEANNQNHNRNSSNHGRKKRVINYWCFSPGVAMEDLKRLGVRSVLITSGIFKQYVLT